MTVIKILTLNLEAGMNIHKGYWQYITSSWKCLIPYKSSVLDKVARYINDNEIDIATFTEIDGGSYRTKHINQLRFLANSTNLKYTSFSQTFKLGRLLDQGNGLISKFPILKREYYKLFSKKQSRYLEFTTIKIGEYKVHVIVTHLTLKKKYRIKEIHEISTVLKNSKDPIIITGDFNTENPEEIKILEDIGLIDVNKHKTYPSWNPMKCFDHVIVSKHFKVKNIHTVNLNVSDHQGVFVELEL